MRNSPRLRRKASVSVFIDAAGAIALFLLFFAALHLPTAV